MALVAAGTKLATGAIGSLLPKLLELLKEEYGLQKGVREKIQSLSRELEAAHAALCKIGNVPLEEQDTQQRLWAREIREASYDMEDIIDSFLVRVDDGREPTDSNMLKRFFRKKVGKLFKSKARRKISTLIQDVNKKLEEVQARRGRYTVDSIVAKPAAATTIDPRLRNVFKMATDLVGIVGPRDELINKLSLVGDADKPDNNKMKVISIVGVGGLGKTTLANAVYEHLKQHFEREAFVVVGQNPDMKKVFRNILFRLDKNKSRDDHNTMVLDEFYLMQELKKIVEERRCFIVIDDIWDLDTWESIWSVLQHSNCGSRVVVTTRIFKVVTHADEVYKMQPLSHENSEKLLNARIVGGEGKYSGSLSKEACDKILKKCGGVPLAIITIASLLASKPGEDWSVAYDSIGFGHGNNNLVDTTRKILSFSYYNLPSQLKPCLLYLGVFPEDHVIEKNMLIWKWIAEDFIKVERTAEVEGPFELGERYFNELINRSMIQPKETKCNGYVDACSVHDMVLDLIHSLSSSENFVTVLDGNKRQELSGSIARRLALQHVEEPSGGLPNIPVEKVRSLHVRGCAFGTLSCPRLPVLRVLDIENCYVHQDFPDYLGSLLHLRYLRIDYMNCEIIKDEYGFLSGPPRKVKYLKFLQTLDVTRTWVTGEPLEDDLPEDLGLLTQLVCLRTDTTAPPGLISKLTSLQELAISAPNIDHDGYPSIMQFVKDLGMLRELRVLRITSMDIIDESMERALLESLGNLHNIRTMDIRGSALCWLGTCDAMSFVSHRSLQYLFLESFVFPGLPLVPYYLSYLNVRVRVVREQHLETLARLPELCCLILRVGDTKSVVSIKIVNDGVGYFQKLRTLRIWGASVWFDLRGCKCDDSVIASAIMPSLESLQFAVHVRTIKDATQLGFEELLGFESLGRSSLQRVTVQVNCRRAGASELKEVETVLGRVAAVHPKHPSLQTEWNNRNDGEPEPLRKEGMTLKEKALEIVKKSWKLVEENIVRPLIQALHTPDPAASSCKFIRLLYSNYSASSLLVLSSNGVHELWECHYRDEWRQEMTNDMNSGDRVEATACIAVIGSDLFIISTAGGRVSFYLNSNVMRTFMLHPPAANVLALYPQDNNIMAIGREDSTIQIYDIGTDEVIAKLSGHKKKITGLAFSYSMDVLVSSGADAQLCVWSTDGWEKKKSRYIQGPSNNASGALAGDTTVQFYDNGTHLLSVHESQLAVYDGNLECLSLWSPTDALPSPISCAVYDSSGPLVYAGFCDGAIGIFEAVSLDLHCRIAPSAYIPSLISSGGGITAIAGRNLQIAVATSDGALYLLKPPVDPYIEDIKALFGEASSG